MFSHITVGTNDMDAARRFYDALFAAMGARPGVFDEKGRLLYFKDGRMFGVTAPIDGQPACHANGGTIGIFPNCCRRKKAGRQRPIKRSRQS